MSAERLWTELERAAEDYDTIPEHLRPVVTAPQPSAFVTTGYPCDRGISDNVIGRGWHHFEASPNGVVVCRYCGQKP